MKKYLILIVIIIFYGCPDGDDDQITLPPTIEVSCCGTNPYQDTNVDNLDQSQGEIKTLPYITPNNDGINDSWSIDNLNYYPNNTITIYNSNNEIIFQTNEFGSTENPFFPLQENVINGILPVEGVYKYKLVIENEETFLKYGYFCVIVDYSNLSTTDTTGCSSAYPDPILRN